MLRSLVSRLGVGWATTGITVASIILSVAITYVISRLIGRSVSTASLAIAIIVPAVIGPAFSWMFLRTIRSLVLAEDRLRELSTVDELTQAYNRRRILEVAEAERVRARRLGRPMSVVVLDVDSFKTINDTHGHPGGDAALQQLAAACRKHCRAIDYFARYGGEEFMFVLPEIGSPQASEFADRIRRVLADTHVGHNGSTIRFTVSVGVATLGDETLDSLLLRADSALYAAKRSGKNTVVNAEDLTADSASTGSAKS